MGLTLAFAVDTAVGTKVSSRLYFRVIILFVGSLSVFGMSTGVVVISTCPLNKLDFDKFLGSPRRVWARVQRRVAHGRGAGMRAFLRRQ